MSNQALEKKFADLADGILSATQARRVMDLCWSVEKLNDVGDVVRGAC